MKAPSLLRLLAFCGWSLSTYAFDITDQPARLTNDANARFTWSCLGTCELEYCLDDGTSWVSLGLERTSLELTVPDGNHSIVLRSQAQVEHRWWWIVDTHAPSTELVSFPPAISRSTNVTFAFRADEAIVGYRWRLDDEDVLTASLANGHCFGEARLSWRTRALNVSFTASLELACTSAPVPFAQLAIDVPVACGASNSTGLSPSTSLTEQRWALVFLSEVGADGDEDLALRATIKDSLDCAPVAGSSLRLLDTNGTVQLSAALEYQQIDTWWLSGVLASAGTHRFEVAAVDRAGNVDPTPAAYTWVFDTSPLTLIDSAPRPVAYSGSAMFRASCMLISSVGAQLQWASSANCDFEFSLDGAGMRSLESHSTLEISGLEDGSHNISMRACQIGHMPRLCDAHPPTITWSVDTTAPSTRFVSAKDLMPLVVHRETVFAFGSSKDHVSFSCRLDGNNWESCGSRATFALSDGEHTLDVRAIDDTGNPDSTPLSHAFRVNTLETALLECPPHPITQRPVVVRARPTFTDVVGITCRGCTVRFFLDGVEVARPVNSSNDGGSGEDGEYDDAFSHTFETLSVGVHRITAQAERASDALADPTPATCLVSVRPSTPDPTTTVQLISGPAVVSTEHNSTFVFARSAAPPPARPSNHSINVSAGGNDTALPSFDAGTSAADALHNQTEARDAFSYSFDTLGLLDMQPSLAPSTAPTAPPLSLQYWLQTATALDNSTAPQWKDVARDGRLKLSLPGGAYTLASRVAPTEDLLESPIELVSVRTWTIDTVPPIITVLAAPDVVSHSSRNVSIAYCASTPHNTFLVELNGLVLFQTSSPTVTLPRLAPGNHTLSLTAIDAALLRGPGVTFSWRVELNRPETYFMRAPRTMSASSEALFEFACLRNGSAPALGCSFEYQLDAFTTWVPTGNPVVLYSLLEGKHVLRVRATDALSGLRDAMPATHEWWVDRTAPSIRLLGKPPATSPSLSAKFAFECVDSGTAWITDGPAATAAADGRCAWPEPCSFEYRLDGAAWARATPPLVLVNVTDNRTHAVDLRATDAAGNVGASITHTWTVDSLRPDTRIETQPENPSDSARAVFLLASSVPLVQYDYRLDEAEEWEQNVSTPLVLSTLREGQHNVSVRSRTREGVVSPDSTYGWSVDLTAPATTIVSGPDPLTHLTSATFMFEASEPVRTYEYQLDSDEASELDADSDDDGPSSAHSASQWHDAGNSSVLHLHSFGVGTHTLRVRASDRAGNSDSSPAQHTWVVRKSEFGGPPSSPLDVVAVAGNARITVSWTPPLDDGGAAIRSYRVRGSTQYAAISIYMSATIEGDPPRTSVAFKATNKLPCTFEVVAFNEHGGSAVSIPSASVVPRDDSDPCGSRFCGDVVSGATSAVPHGSCFLESSDGVALRSYCQCRPGYEGHDCSDALRPKRARAAWVAFPWGGCSEQCGNRGTRSRVVECREFVSGIPLSTPARNASRCEAVGEIPSAFEDCSAVSCAENHLVVDFELRVFYEDAAASATMASAFYKTIRLELSHALNVQPRRIVDVNAWPSSMAHTHVSFIISAGDSEDDQSVDYLSQQLRLQALHEGSALRASGTWARHIVPSSLSIEVGPVSAIMYTRSIMLGLIELFSTLGLILIALSVCGRRLARHRERWLKRADRNPFEYVMCAVDDFDSDDDDDSHESSFEDLYDRSAPPRVVRAERESEREVGVELQDFGRHRALV